MRASRFELFKRSDKHGRISSPGSLISLSVFGRLTLASLIVVLLVVAISGIGLWYMATIQRSIRVTRQGSTQIQNIYRLRLSWQDIASTVDNLLITRSLSAMEAELTLSEESFNQQLLDLSTQTLGTTSADDNRLIINELQQISSEISQNLDEFKARGRSGRWQSATALRQSTIDSLQSQLLRKLDTLDQNVQADVEAATAEVDRVQGYIRLYWIIVGLAALVFSLLIGWVTARSIVQPINQLKATVGRITQGDLGPIPSLNQNDEIGDLSRSIALMTTWLRESYETLEKRVVERTQDLERRTMQIRVAAEVARDIALSRNLASLLTTSVDLIRERFGFYHAGVFLVDDRREYAVLQAATGQAGEEMLRRGHKLKVGETGLVGYVTLSGHSRIVLDVGQDAVHFKNPLLPETRSEVALPLRTGNRIIGALDVQSREASAFDEDSLTILQIMADQLAVAIESARLLTELQSKLQELEQLSARYSQQAWQRFSQTSSSVVGYEYDGMEVTPLLAGKKAGDETGDAQPAPASAEKPSDGQQQFPLRLRGEVIGTLDVWPGSGELSAEELYVLESLSNRLGQTLESSRLFEETQIRAAYEQALNRLTASFVRSLDLDGVLRIAARELGQLPSVSEVSVYLEAGGDRIMFRQPEEAEQQSREADSGEPV